MNLYFKDNHWVYEVGKLGVIACSRFEQATTEIVRYGADYLEGLNVRPIKEQEYQTHLEVAIVDLRANYF